MERALHRRRHALEAVFFLKQDAALREQQRLLEQKKHTRKTMAAISGINNERIIDELMALEVSLADMAALAVAPLVAVAWADGTVQDNERRAVLAAAAANGIAEKTAAFAVLSAWLTHRPPKKLLIAWQHYCAGICEALSPADRSAFKAALLERASSVAEASGGFLGLTTKVSPAERDVLAQLSAAFD